MPNSAKFVLQHYWRLLKAPFVNAVFDTQAGHADKESILMDQ